MYDVHSKSVDLTIFTVKSAAFDSHLNTNPLSQKVVGTCLHCQQITVRVVTVLVACMYSAVKTVHPLLRPSSREFVEKFLIQALVFVA